jgi:hypothetical protein
MNESKFTPGRALLVFLTLVLLTLALGGCAAGVKAYSRYQDRADRNQARQQALYDARNQTQINEIRISQQAQLVKVAQQQAQIRFENAVGVRKAQDEISSTLTPLYVQFEMVDALKTVAASGRNNTVVYIPTGDNGVPLISTVDPTKVGK